MHDDRNGDGDGDSDKTVLDSSPPSSPPSPCVWASGTGEVAAGWLKRRSRAATAPGMPSNSTSHRASTSPDKTSVATANASAPFEPSVRRTEGMALSVKGSRTIQTRPLSPRRELLLSPASQLDVLSQISELADSQARQAAALPTSSITTRPTKRAHMWAPALQPTSRKRCASSSGRNDSEESVGRQPTAKPKTKKGKQTDISRTEKLAADMLDWETCSEDLFDGEEEQDDWGYENISDEDFE